MKNVFKLSIKWIICMAGMYVFLICYGKVMSVNSIGFSNPEVSIEYVNDGDFMKSDHYLEKNFKTVLQNPELPTGCEITAMTMVLNYYGFDVDKVEMAELYLPTQPYEVFYGADGRLYGSDLNRYFIGDPKGKGYVCGPEAIITAANAYLKDAGSSLRAENLSGIRVEKMYRYIDKNIPVVVWTTIQLKQRQPVEGWYTEEGVYVDWSTSDHCGVLIGYTDTEVTLADPISGHVVYDRQRFEDVFASRGNQCLILQ